MNSTSMIYDARVDFEYVDYKWTAVHTDTKTRLRHPFCRRQNKPRQKSEIVFSQTQIERLTNRYPKHAESKARPAPSVNGTTSAPHCHYYNKILSLQEDRMA